MNTQPIFIFSLPRSGSTLVQRVLSTHAEIATVSEPWILLPLFYCLRPEGAWTEYGHKKAVTGIDDLARSLPGGRVALSRALAASARELYNRIAGNKKYFVDKTPRYYLIARDIFSAFPDAKFIFLWRNPLSVAASIIDTWGDGAWNLYRYRIDLYDGITNLTALYKDVQDAENVLSLRYEDLVENGSEQWERLFQFIDLPFERNQTESVGGVDIKGTWGDKRGVKEYSKITNASVKKWVRTLSGPIRTRWAMAYLDWVGEDRLAVMGYSRDKIRSELNDGAMQGGNILSDLLRMLYGEVYTSLELSLFKNKFLERPHVGRRFRHLT